MVVGLVRVKTVSTVGPLRVPSPFQLLKISSADWAFVTAPVDTITPSKKRESHRDTLNLFIFITTSLD
jgi:hypothetical protein